MRTRSKRTGPTLRDLIRLAAVVTLAGCGDDSHRTSLPVVKDSAGIVIVDYDLAPDAPRYRLPETPILNLASGDEFFNRTSTFTRDHSGRYLVVDNSGGARVFDAEGRLRSRVSRFGEGPSEIGRARRAWWNPDGGFTIYDEMRPGLLRFDQDLNFADRQALSYKNGTFAGLLSGGEVVIVRSPPQEFPLGYSRERLAVHVIEADGDTLTWPRILPGQGVTSLDPGGLFPPCPYGHSRLLAAADRLFIGELAGGRPSLAFFTPEGDVVRILRRPGPAPPPPTADQLAFATAEFRYHTSEEMANEWIDYAQCDLVTVAEVGRLFVDDGGRLWMAREIPFPAWEARTWDVFHPDGVHLATFEVHPHFRLTSVHGDHLLGVLTTELGEELPLVFQIESLER